MKSSESQDIMDSNGHLNASFRSDYRQPQHPLCAPLPPASLVFKNVSVTLAKNEILKNVSALARVGQILAIMGPSGAGKSTLLNALAGRVPPNSGSITLHGQPVNRGLRRQISYVLQHDVFYPNLTLNETLQFAAMLRLPDGMPKELKMKRVSDLVEGLEMTRCLHTDMERLSGGERKCASIACELLTNPALIMLDEPTTGLDSVMASNLMATLTNYARKSSKTVVTTIHQPSSQVFHLFSDVLLMHDGEVAYFGRASTITDFFSALGLHCDPCYNPADFILEQVKAGPDTSRRIVAASYAKRETEEWPEELKDAWQTRAPAPAKPSSQIIKTDLSSVSESDKDEVHDWRDKNGEVERYMIPGAMWQTGFRTQYIQLTKRSFLRSRKRYLSMSVILQMMFVAAFAGMEWFQISNKEEEARDKLGALFFSCSLFGFFPMLFSAFAVIDETGVFMRERSSGIYRLSAYYLASITTEVPIIVCLCTVFDIILYWMVGLTPAPFNFIAYWLIHLLHSFTSQSLGILFGITVKTRQMAITCIQCFFVGSLLAGGFYNTHTPFWFTWPRYLSYATYTYSAFGYIEFALGNPVVCSPPNSTIFPNPCAQNGTTTFPGTLILSSQGLDAVSIYCSILVLFGISVVCRVSSYFVLRYHRRPKS